MVKKTKKVAKKHAQVVDVKKAAANDKETPVVKLPTKNASAVQKGATYAVLAGRPPKQAVTAVFGKTGYSYSWVKRAELMNVTPENLCARFKADPQQVKADWASPLEKK